MGREVVGTTPGTAMLSTERRAAPRLDAFPLFLPPPLLLLLQPRGGPLAVIDTAEGSVFLPLIPLVVALAAAIRFDDGDRVAERRRMGAERDGVREDAFDRPDSDTLDL